MRPREQFSDTWHITLGLSHITLCVTVVAANVNKSLTYGLRVLPGRGGVVVIVAGGDVGVGVSPLVLHPRPPGVTLTMHRLVSVLRPAMQHYYKFSARHNVTFLGQCLTCVCKHRMRPCCPWSRRGCMTRIRCSCRWARWGRRRPRVSGSSCNVDNVMFTIFVLCHSVLLEEDWHEKCGLSFTPAWSSRPRETCDLDGGLWV